MSRVNRGIRKAATKRGGFQLCELFRPGEDYKLRLARQIGINHAIVDAITVLREVPRDRYIQTLDKLKAEFKAGGMTIAGIESHPVPAEKIKLGLPAATRRSKTT